MQKGRFFDVAPPYQPINKLAQAVLKPQHIDDRFETRNHELGRSESETPFPVRKLTRRELGNRELKDLTGAKFGRMIVVGYYADKPRWVLRCACGTYALRSNKALRNAVGRYARMACSGCMADAKLKRNDYVRRTGKEADTEDFL